MSNKLLRRIGFVCQICKTSQSSNLHLRSFTTSTLIHGPSQHPSRPSPRTARVPPNLVRNASAAIPAAPRFRNSTAKPHDADTKPRKKATLKAFNPINILESLRNDVVTITSTNTVPDETDVLIVLDRMYQFSNIIVFGQPEGPMEAGEEQWNQDTAASTLSDLDESKSKKIDISKVEGLTLSFRAKAAETIAELAYRFVRDPKIFISLPALQFYTRIQCLLGKPQYLPEIFYLYANKPIPVAKSSPIKYSNPWPKSPKNAVPQELADAGLEAAIIKKDMPLAIAIIDTTVATSAFRRNRMLRKASLPIAFVSMTPVIAYAFSQWVSVTQNTWDADTSLWMTMAGTMAYIGTLTTIGFVAIATFNDHHIRVVWAPGTYLWRRVVREEERLYLDRVALAWGFQKKHKRGEEQGEEWENLREIAGLRGMILDKTDLMEGMQ